MIKVGDVVTVVKEAVEANKAKLIYEDTAYIVVKKINNGEYMFRLKGLNNQSGVFLRGDNGESEYNFVEEELEILCPKEAYDENLKDYGETDEN